jgi:PEP-CTERM motif
LLLSRRSWVALLLGTALASPFAEAAGATVIDLLEHPEALPSDKPSEMLVTASAGSDTDVMTFDVRLDAVEFDTSTNLVTYFQLDPMTISFGEVGSSDSLTISNLSSVLDPTGSFSASYTDFGAPSTFTTIFVFPAFAPTLFNTVQFSGSASGSVTDGAATPDGVSYSPSGVNPGVFKYELLDTTNAVISTFFLDSGASFAAGPPNTHTTGPEDNSGSPLSVNANPNGVGTVLVTGSFLGSGGLDQYAFTGRWDVINVVPEPGTALLLTSGLMGLAVYGRRKRSR